MADLIEYLDKLNAERASLMMYGRRMRKVSWLFPGLVKRLLNELDEKWRDVSRERERVAEVIWADPVLRLRMKEREAAAIEGARENRSKKPITAPLPGRPVETSQGVKECALRVVGLEHEEARRQNHYDEALFYYGSGAWQNDGVEVGKLTKLMDQLMVERDQVRLHRHRLLDGLQSQLEAEGKTYGSLSLARENVLKNLRAEFEAPVREGETPLSHFLEKERKPADRVKGKKNEHEPTQ